MFKRLASLMVVAALACTLGGTVAFASEPLTSDGQVKTANNPSHSDSTRGSQAQTSKSLKEGIQNLVANAKAGKGMPVSKPQIQPRQSNGLSKGAKIAIGVGVAAAVILVIVLVAGKNTPGRVL